jgi:hypothetical protein
LTELRAVFAPVLVSWNVRQRGSLYCGSVETAVAVAVHPLASADVTAKV